MAKSIVNSIVNWLVSIFFKKEIIWEIDKPDWFEYYHILVLSELRDKDDFNYENTIAIYNKDLLDKDGFVSMYDNSNNALEHIYRLMVQQPDKILFGIFTKSSIYMLNYKDGMEALNATKD